MVVWVPVETRDVQIFRTKGFPFIKVVLCRSQCNLKVDIDGGEGKSGEHRSLVVPFLLLCLSGRTVLIDRD